VACATGANESVPARATAKKYRRLLPTLAGLPVRHRLLLINAHRLGIYGPLLNQNTFTHFGQRTSFRMRYRSPRPAKSSSTVWPTRLAIGQRTLLGNNPKGARRRH